MDTLARTRELLARGGPIEEVVRQLRVEGFSMMESMSALIRASGMSYEDGKTAVIDSPVWADRRDRVVTRAWIDPPERPDLDTVERLQVACSEDPRIEEVWVTGSQMTRHDGSSSDVSTVLAILLDPPAPELGDEERFDMMTKLGAAWPKKRRGWLWVNREMIARHQQHCVAIYSRR